ncbi:MAG: beta-ketoacyl synthase chain length factor [Pseudomonadota bacterium]
MTALSAYVDGISVLGPGLPDWPATESMLAGRAPYVPARTVLPVAMSLPSAERRRAGRVIRLALATGLEATSRAGLDPKSLVTIFTSSTGDGDNCHEICQTLASADRHISPTRFHNSVHNAAAGYWSIAIGAMASSTTLCAYDGSFAAGLLEAMVQVAVVQQPILLIAYDTDYPSPLREVRPVPDAFGVALVLAPTRTGRSMVKLKTQLRASMNATLDHIELEALRSAIPAARSLPLLRLIARQEYRAVGLEYLGSTSLCAQVLPC